MTHLRLFINIDHVATLRQARRADEPDPVAAGRLCEDAGADGITAHLREDRRHIHDADVEGLMRALRTPFNLEMACTEEMLTVAERLRPHHVTLVPEHREEVTTEGGLDVTLARTALEGALKRLRQARILSSLFIDPEQRMIEHAAALGADAVELHTGAYANAFAKETAGAAADSRTLLALRAGAELAAARGLAVHAGHGLTLANVGPVAAIAQIEELNIGHHIVSHAIFEGLAAAVGAMRRAMDAARVAKP